MFYHYSQNNSGGSFDFDPASGITHNVIIEARDGDHADERAKEIGLYFNGVEDGLDCDCCGNRWSQSYGNGTDEPTIYGEPVTPHWDKKRMFFKWIKGPETFVHYLNGEVKGFHEDVQIGS